MSAQDVALFGLGAEPPPESTEPIRYAARSLGAEASAVRSTCVIWPTFSSSDMRESRSSTRCATGSEGSWYGSPAACAPACVVAAVAWTAALVRESIARTAPRATPALRYVRLDMGTPCGG